MENYWLPSTENPLDIFTTLPTSQELWISGIKLQIWDMLRNSENKIASRQGLLESISGLGSIYLRSVISEINRDKLKDTIFEIQSIKEKGRVVAYQLMAHEEVTSAWKDIAEGVSTIETTSKTTTSKILVRVYNPDENSVPEAPNNGESNFKLNEDPELWSHLVVVLDGEDIFSKLDQLWSHIMASVQTILILDCDESDLNIATRQALETYGKKVSCVNGFDTEERNVELTNVFYSQCKVPLLELPHSDIPTAQDLWYYSDPRMSFWNILVNNFDALVEKQQFRDIWMQDNYLRTCVSPLNEKLEELWYCVSLVYGKWYKLEKTQRSTKSKPSPDASKADVESYLFSLDNMPIPKHGHSDATRSTSSVGSMSSRSVAAVQNKVRPEKKLAIKKEFNKSFKGLKIVWFSDTSVLVNDTKLYLDKKEFKLLDMITKDASTPSFSGVFMYRRIHNVHPKKRIKESVSIEPIVASLNNKFQKTWIAAKVKKVWLEDYVLESV